MVRPVDPPDGGGVNSTNLYPFISNVLGIPQMKIRATGALTNPAFAATFVSPNGQPVRKLKKFRTRQNSWRTVNGYPRDRGLFEAKCSYTIAATPTLLSTVSTAEAAFQLNYGVRWLPASFSAGTWTGTLGLDTGTWNWLSSSLAAPTTTTITYVNARGSKTTRAAVQFNGRQSQTMFSNFTTTVLTEYTLVMVVKPLPFYNLFHDGPIPAYQIIDGGVPSGNSDSAPRVLSATAAVAALSVTVTLAAAYTVGMKVQIGTGAFREIRTVSASTATTITFTLPLLYQHLSGDVVIPVSFTETVATETPSLGLHGNTWQLSTTGAAAPVANIPVPYPVVSQSAPILLALQARSDGQVILYTGADKLTGAYQISRIGSGNYGTAFRLGTQHGTSEPAKAASMLVFDMLWYSRALSGNELDGVGNRLSYSYGLRS